MIYTLLENHQLRFSLFIQYSLRMVKSRTKKLNDRWGNETSAKGTRFKLNRDLVGFHLTSRNAIEIQEDEVGVKIKLPDVNELKVKGSLIHLENVGFGY